MKIPNKKSEFPNKIKSAKLKIQNSLIFWQIEN